MFDDPGDGHLALVVAALAVAISLTAVRWLTCCVGRRDRAVEDRTWSWCPRCGWPRPNDDATAPMPVGKWVVTTPLERGPSRLRPSPQRCDRRQGRTHTANTRWSGEHTREPPVAPESLRPSDLLKRGWCRRGLAMNRAGDALVNTAPGNWQQPVAWSICGASLGALREEPRLCHAYEECLSQVLRKWYGVSDPVEWNGDPRRAQEEAVAVALETERRLFAST